MAKQDFLSIQQFDKKFYSDLFIETDNIRKFPIKNRQKNEGLVGALIFFEPSTRTRMSFEISMIQEGFSPVRLDSVSGSSLEKGESHLDTILNIEAMGPQFLVIRCGDDFDLIDYAKKSQKTIINAGWGKKGHPTQALLDVLTLREAWAHKIKNVNVQSDLLNTNGTKIDFTNTDLTKADLLKIELLKKEQAKEDRTKEDRSKENQARKGQAKVDQTNEYRIKEEQAREDQNQTDIVSDDLRVFQGKKLLIVGDIVHSRVATSHFQLAQILGYELALCGPDIFLDSNIKLKKFSKLSDGLQWCDAVMALRVQFERHESKFEMGQYHKLFGLNLENLKHLRSDGVILHPGPINHGVEFDPNVFNDPRCFVFNQVRNGVLIRQALIRKLV